MRALLAFILALTCAVAASAQVQVRSGAAATPSVPAGALPGVRAGSGLASMPLAAPSSLSASLAAPSLSPSPAVAGVLAAAPSPNAASAVPAALVRAAVPFAAASKADDVRTEAARTVAQRRAERAGAPADALTPAAALPGAVSPDLDALFDGSLPTSREVLARAAGRGLSRAALGAAVAESKTLEQAASRLVSLGALGKSEAGLAGADADGFRFLLTRVWREASSAVPGEFPVDASWGVDALKVERGGTTYYVHGVAHGRHVAARRGAVLALAERLRKAGRALYSEQNLPAFYGYVFGRETLDHGAPSAPTTPTAVVDAAPGWSASGLVVKNAFDRVLAPGSALAAAAWAALQPGSAWPWLALAGALLFSFLTMTSGIAVNRWRHRRRAAMARDNGWEDIADQYDDEARHYFAAKPDLDALRGLELPQPLGASEEAASIRSRAMADAIAADAALAGAKNVHLVVGHLHAHEVAWRLKHGPKPESPGAHIS